MIILQKTALNLAGKQENSNFGIQIFLVSVGWLKAHIKQLTDE